MKNILIIALIVFISNFIKAQDTTFNKYLYPFHEATSIRNLIKFNNSYIAFVGQTSSNYRQNYGLIKLNNSGEIIDSSFFYINNKYKGTFTVYGHGFTLTRDTNLLACGDILDTNGSDNGFLIKFDNNLDTIWTKEYYHPDTIAALQNPDKVHMKLTDIKETLDGGYIIVGNYNKDCIGNVNRTFLIKTDSNGEIENYYGNDFGSRSYDIELTKDSGYVYLVSHINSYSLIKANKYGETEWKYSLADNKVYAPANEITFLNDSIIIIGTQYVYNDNSITQLDIGMFNINSRNMIWRNYYELFFTFRNLTLAQSLNINIAKDSNIIVSGSSWIEGPNSFRAAILKLNQNGDSLWSRYYSHNNNDSDNVELQLNDLIICDDGGFLFGGFASVEGTGFANSWLVKTDSMGITNAAFTIGVKENTLVIKKIKPLLYPNPVTDNFNLRFREIPTENYQLSIYSSSGTLVKQKQLSAFGNEYIVNVQELKSGVYFVRLESGRAIVYSGKFIKQ